MRSRIWPKILKNNKNKKILQHNIVDELIQKHDYIDANQEFTADPRRSSPSLPHLIGNENVFLPHFYTTNARMKLESGKVPHPL
jgi:hypothetical protein